MFGFGKPKEKATIQQEKSVIDNYRKCIQNGFVSLAEISNGQPVLLKIANIPLYEIKTSRTYLSTSIGRGRIGASSATEGWKFTDTGTLIITTNGILFYGNKTTLNFQRSKVLNIYSIIGRRKHDITGVRVHISNRTKPVIFGVNPPDYVKEIMLFGLTATPNWKVTMYESKPRLIDTNKFPSGNLE